MQFRVLEPVLEKTTEPFINERGHKDGYVYRWVGWKELGIASGWDECYAKFPRCKRNGYSHILEEITTGVH